MGGFLGLGNSSAKTDRGNQLGGINAEWNLYNRGLPMFEDQSKAGTATTDAGLSTLDAAKAKWEEVMSGARPPVNKPQVMQAAAPAINAVNEQSDAARKEQAEMGTSRGGGVNAGNQEAQTQRMAAASGFINDTANKQQQESVAQEVAGATGTTNVGTTQANIGNQQMARALQALGISNDVAQEIINSSIQSRPISMKANAEVRQQWSNFLAGLGL